MTGYIKRVPLEAYRAQKRGGKGRSRDEHQGGRCRDRAVRGEHACAGAVLFSTAGKVYRKKVWRLPEGAPNARGRAMANLLPLAEGETISTVLPLPENEAEWGHGCM